MSTAIHGGARSRGCHVHCHSLLNPRFKSRAPTQRHFLLASASRLLSHHPHRARTRKLLPPSPVADQIKVQRVLPEPHTLLSQRSLLKLLHQLRSKMPQSQ